MIISEKDKTRFEAKINKDTKNSCHEWTAHLVSSGYGGFKYKRKQWLAHRFTYILHHGEIPKGKVIMHKCDNKKCVNPDHLKLGTQVENIADMVAKGRAARQKGENHGMYDHIPYTFENKKKGWKLSCTQNYLRTTFNLYASNVSAVVLGKLKTVSGWSLTK